MKIADLLCIGSITSMMMMYYFKQLNEIVVIFHLTRQEMGVEKNSKVKVGMQGRRLQEMGTTREKENKK